MTPPEWDPEQLEVIRDEPSSWQVVVAGPGTGKSAVACQRIAHLIQEGVSASKILLISFTRTAVSEIRDRILSYCVAGDEAKRVRITTIDSHAWSLRAGFDDVAPAPGLTDNSYELGIQRTVELLRVGRPELREFLAGLEHVLIDEAQDIVGARATLIRELLGCLSTSCGVTILADPAQAIYGFTADDAENDDTSGALLDSILADVPRRFAHRELRTNHRVKDVQLARVFADTRRQVASQTESHGHIARIESAIRESCGQDVGQTPYDRLADFLARAGRNSMLVLFRSRAEVLIASSYCSDVGVEHRLRMSGLPTVASPWIGWLLGDVTSAAITRQNLDELWAQRCAEEPGPFRAVNKDAAWALLHQFAAGTRKGTIELAELRRHLSRPRPPVELCEADIGTRGPILGTIHASKGREADTVMLFLPSREGSTHGSLAAATFEEGRVLYVGATRARKLLASTGYSAPQTTTLEYGRTVRWVKGKAQIEIGRQGDIDPLAHLAWSSNRDVQRKLASLVGTSDVGRLVAKRDAGYAWRLFLHQYGGPHHQSELEIAEMSSTFAADIKRLWSRLDASNEVRPKNLISHVHVVGVSTIGLTDEQMSAVRAPYNQSGIALVPVIKAFSAVQFERRRAEGA